MSKHDQFILFMNSGLGGDWTHFLLLVYFYCDGSWLFTLCLIFCLNFMAHIQYPFYYFSANKKYPLFSILLQDSSVIDIKTLRQVENFLVGKRCCSGQERVRKKHIKKYLKKHINKPTSSLNKAISGFLRDYTSLVDF